MRIVHAANADRKKHYRFLYNCDHKLAFAMTRLGHAVYNFSDRDVARELSWFKTRTTGVGAANKAFLKVIANVRPDVIVLGHADIVSNGSLAQARKICPDVRIAYYNVDGLFVPKVHAAISARSGHVDAMFLTTGGQQIQQFAHPSTQVYFMPNPVDASLEAGRAWAHADLPMDMIFCTVKAQDDDPRAVFVRKLNDALPQLRIGAYGMFGEPARFGAEFLQLLPQSKMALNLSRTGGEGHSAKFNYWYSSDRIAQLMGNGLLTFIERSTGLDALYSDAEAVFFDGWEELLERLRFYHEHDTARMQVAQAGWQRAHSAFSGEMVAQYILDRVLDQPLSQPYAWVGVEQTRREHSVAA